MNAATCLSAVLSHVISIVNVMYGQSVTLISNLYRRQNIEDDLLFNISKSVVYCSTGNAAFFAFTIAFGIR